MSREKVDYEKTDMLAVLPQLSKVRDWRHLSSNKALRETLLGQLSKDQLKSIYTNYKVDFEMFNYTMDKYL